MAKVKLTKTELRFQQVRLTQLKRYLPTLQLKKSLLQLEVQMADRIVEELEKKFNEQLQKVSHFESLLTERKADFLFQGIEIEEVKEKGENIAGIELPIFEEVVFKELDNFLFDTPVWIDGALVEIRSLIAKRKQIHVAKKRREAIAHELREVSIRVNLFEKILIPRATSNIRRIKVFLGDQQLTAIAQAKAAKKKIQSKLEVAV